MNAILPHRSNKNSLEIQQSTARNLDVNAEAMQSSRSLSLVASILQSNRCRQPHREGEKERARQQYTVIGNHHGGGSWQGMIIWGIDWVPTEQNLLSRGLEGRWEPGRGHAFQYLGVLGSLKS